MGRVSILRFLSHRYLVICLLAVLVVFPISRPNEYVMFIMILGFVYAIAAASWDLISGHTGQISFGHAGLFAAGAYVAAISTKVYGISPWFAILFAASFTAAIGLIFGLPSLRLKGHFLALTSLAFSETIRTIIYTWTGVTGGALGYFGYGSFSEVPNPGQFPFEAKVTEYYIALSFMVVSVFVMYRLAFRTVVGISLRSIREDEVLSESLGVNTSYHKLLSFSVSSFFAGLAGSLYAFFVLTLDPSLAYPLYTTLFIGMAYVGGMGSIIGPVIGAIVLNLLMEALRSIGVVYNLIAAGALIMIAILFFPNGIMGVIQRRILRR